jgi:pimeloyl-ACP methyl ester carboxylesterase
VSTALIELPDPGTPTRHLLRVGGVHVHWAEAGSGRPTVLLHGVCDSHRSWRKVAAALGRTRRVLMPDLPGHGLSDRPDATYTVEWYGAIVGAWIDALGLKTFDLVGHSYGGGVAQVLLLTHAHRIDRLALVGAGGLGTEVAFGLRLWSALRGAERIAQPLLAPGTRLAMEALLPGSDREDVAFMSWMNAMPGTGRSLSRTVQAVIGWKGQKQGLLDRAEELPEVLPRVALFWGSRDPIIPVEHALALVERMENVTLTRFENCGHWPQLEQPEAFALALARFLGEPALERARLRVPFTTPVAPRGGRFLRALWRWLRTFAAALAAWFRQKRLPPP